MQEKLNIFGAGGKVVQERDLGEVKASLLVVQGADGPDFAETAGSDAKIIAALVRDEDGWTIASPDPAVPVVSGPKSVTDMHLTPGIPCKIGDWVFRLERDIGESGAVLVWRNEGSPVAVDAVLSGRNVVSRVADGTIQVNPVLSESDVFEFFPTQDGLDVAIEGDTTSRLSVAPKTLFSVGRFEGMLMTASEAAAAVRSGNAFAWPSRGLRARVYLSLLLLGTVALGGVWMTRQRLDLERQLALPRGARQVDAGKNEVGEIISDDVVVYSLGFYSNLKLFHEPLPNLVTQDFIRRGEQLVSDPDVADMVSYLREISKIKELVQAGRWNELGVFLAKVDRARYVAYEGVDFYDDARELVIYVTEEFPRQLIRVSNVGNEADFEKADLPIAPEQIKKVLKSNLFLTDGVARREVSLASYRGEVVRAYVQARQKVLAGLSAKPMSVDQEAIETYADAYATIDNAFPPEETPYVALMTRERAVATDIAKRGVREILGDGNAASPQHTLLEQFAVLALYAGLPEVEIADWRAKAKAAAKAMDLKCRSIHSRYRIAILTDRQKAIAVLDELLALGATSNRYYGWAVKEKRRLESALKSTEKGAENATEEQK